MIYASYSKGSDLTDENIDPIHLFQDIIQLVSWMVKLNKHDDFEESVKRIQKAITKRYSKGLR